MRLRARSRIATPVHFRGGERVRWYKPGRFAGRLLDLEKLKKACACGQWIRREPLVGGRRTAAAAQAIVRGVLQADHHGIQAHDAAGVPEAYAQDQGAGGVSAQEEVD